MILAFHFVPFEFNTFYPIHFASTDLLATIARVTAQDSLSIINLASARHIDEDLDEVCDDQTQNNFVTTRLIELSLKIPLMTT